MDSTDEASRVVVRLSRPNQRPLNPEALGDFLHEELLTYDPACVEVVLEIDEQAVERIRERKDYEVDVLSVE